MHLVFLDFVLHPLVFVGEDVFRTRDGLIR